MQSKGLIRKQLSNSEMGSTIEYSLSLNV